VNNVGAGFSDNIVDEIKSRCNIIDVIGRHVVLKKPGATIKAFVLFIMRRHLLLLCPTQNRFLPVSAAEPPAT
jgi:hypothetical protein